MVCIDSTMSFDMALRERLSYPFFLVSSPHFVFSTTLWRECFDSPEWWRTGVWDNDMQQLSCHAMTIIIVLQALSIWQHEDCVSLLVVTSSSRHKFPKPTKLYCARIYSKSPWTVTELCNTFHSLYISPPARQFAAPPRRSTKAQVSQFGVKLTS